jgi:hypothetical protein
MAPETLREHPHCLYRRRFVEVMHDHERLNRESPRPTIALRVMLGNADDLDDSKHRLPDRGVQDCELTDLNRRALRGRVRSHIVGLDVSRQWPFAAAAH